MKEMTSRERLMAALGNKQPDRVPVTPDLWCMVPCRLTGKPFWDILYNRNPPLWKAHIDAIKYFDYDGFFDHIDLQFKYKENPQVTGDSRLIKKDDRWEVRSITHTPDGDLTTLTVYPKYDPETLVEKPIKNIEEDYRKYKHTFSDITGYDKSMFLEQKKELGEHGITVYYVDAPGLHSFIGTFDGLEGTTVAYYEYPEIFEELYEMAVHQCFQQLEIALDCGVDAVFTGGSGALTLSSPEIWRKLSLPVIKKITKMCKEAGVISGVHTCGKENYLCESCANETDLNFVNPLEKPPMGDCELNVIKEKFGHRLALMGNLHTTEIMLYGSPADVKRESLKAILDAGIGGGFVLHTGDQCGRDTPNENIFTMIKTAKEFGVYPLDIDRIQDEITLLNHERMRT